MTNDPLAELLQQCSLHSLLMLVSKGLTRSGFGDVQILDRRSAKQKSRFGGHELVCETAIGPLPLKVIVKVIRDDVRLRMLDELAGAVVRTNADLGLLVTPFQVSHSVERLQASYKPLRVEVLSGSHLAELMKRSGIGVRDKGSIDYAFFCELEEVSKRLLKFINANKV